MLNNITGKSIGDIGNSLYIKCDCHGHVLQFERYKEDDIDKGFYISTWKYCDTFSFKDKLRLCWNIIKTGYPWADEVMISDEKALALVNFIESELKNEK